MDNKRPESPEEQQNSQAEEKSNADVASLKKHMTLDLNSGDGNSRKKAKQALLTKGTPGLFSGNLMGSSNLWTPSANVLLESPDLKMLKMASPDLEHFIRTNTNINLTPTPSLANPQLAFEMALECMKAKEQQEQQQHQSPHHSQASLSNNLNLSLSNLNQNLLLNQIISQNTQSKQLEAAVLAEQLQQQQQQSAQNVLSDAELQFKLSQLLARSAAFGSAADLEAISGATASGGQSSLSGVGGAYSDSSRPPSNASSSFYAMNMMNNDSGESSNNTSIASGSRGDAPGASTSGGGGGGSNVSMIDLEDQERLKLERKRMRNRIAASKCRRRKLERISKLEEKVRQLKNENSDLTSIIYKLRENVCHLKEEVLQHMKSGCNINSSLVQT